MWMARNGAMLVDISVIEAGVCMYCWNTCTSVNAMCISYMRTSINELRSYASLTIKSNTCLLRQMRKQ